MQRLPPAGEGGGRANSPDPLILSSLPVQLIQFKADINAANEHGNTPLHYACFWAQEQVAEVSVPFWGVAATSRLGLAVA